MVGSLEEVFHGIEDLGLAGEAGEAEDFSTSDEGRFTDAGGSCDDIEGFHVLCRLVVAEDFAEVAFGDDEVVWGGGIDDAIVCVVASE